MKKIISIYLFLVITAFTAKSQSADLLAMLPDSIYSGKQGRMHVQGVVIDTAKKVVYFSFTDRLIKMDLSGKVIGSVTGFVGHLGDLDFDEKEGKIYGSLEYKNDAIGKGIKKELGLKDHNQNGFYIAIFDGSRIIRPNMNAEKEDLLRTVYVKEAVLDYEAQVKVGNELKPHRFACSGIDGVAFAPSIGRKSGKKFLYVAYGVYGDQGRDDNDHQVILKYDVSNWEKYAQHLSQDKLHTSGPKKPLEKYFVKTGNTRYGVQNLAYDAHTGNFFAAVYRGSKPQFPNYDLFVIDAGKKAGTARIQSDGKTIKVKTLALAESGPLDAKSGIRGWNFAWGATGLCPVGDGYFYISHSAKDKDGQQSGTIYKYKWVGDATSAFERVK